MTEFRNAAGAGNAALDEDSAGSPPAWFHRLRIRLFLLVVLAVVPMLALVVYRSWDQEQQDRQKVVEALSSFIQTTPLLQQQQLESGKQLLSTLAQMERWKSPTNNFNTSNGILFSNLLHLHTLYFQLGVVDADGRVLAGGASGMAEASHAGSVWFQRVRETLQFTVGEFIPAGRGQKPAVKIAYPILDRTNGTFMGAAYASIDISWLKSIAPRAALPAGTSLTVVDRSQRIVFRYPEPGANNGHTAALATDTLPEPEVWKSSGNGVREFVSQDGVKRLYALTALIGDEAAPELRLAVGIRTESAFAATRRTLWLNLEMLGVATLLSCIVGWMGAERLVSRGIDPLLTVTRELHQGNLSARTRMPHRAGELGQLAAAVDEMAESLEKRVQERQQTEARLKVLNQDLEQRIEARTAELVRSNRELEEFAYVASHDLQEPLRMISGHLQLLEKRYKGRLGEDADEFIHFAVDGAKRMDQLILDLLAYSRVGTQAKPFEPVDLDGVLQRSIANLQHRIQESGAEIVTETMPRVMGDSLQLTLVFQNLIGNALKFRGTQPPRVEISCVPAIDRPDKFWMVQVQDNGIGIEPQYYDRIFQIFQRLHSRETYPGTGIGLSICKRVVERHGGRIWLDSSQGKGTCFFFTLPRVP